MKTKKLYSLVYEKQGEEKKRLYEDESLENVEKKRSDYGFTYNNDFLFIEEIYIGKVMHEKRKDDEDESSSSIGKGGLVTLLIVGTITFLNYIIKHKYGEENK